MTLRKTMWLIGLPGILFAVTLTAFSQTAPEVFKIDPPSWWVRSTVNPVRLLIRGTNLKGARVQTPEGDLRIVSAPKANDRGTYLFVDVAISPGANPGPRQIRITTPSGTTQ